MSLHRNAKLGLAGRYALVCAIERGMTLKPAGISRRPAAAREAANRYEWPCPGDLLHMDTSRYARFLRPGHRVTGDRSQHSRNWMRPETRVGYDYAHAIVDDHSRLAFVE